MATEIDQRIVEMRFDNKDFEKNVAKTMKTLDEFDAKLDFNQYAQTFSSIEQASKKVSLDTMKDAAEKVAVKFSAMEIVAITAISRITNSVIDMSTKMVKSLTLDQVNAGWDKYADKTSAVQTIMAATSKEFSDQAEQMEYVNAQLNKLNWFTDETSYNFLDMVSNIGKFTSQGMKLDDSVTAMQGIATWAAISGANATEASRAMYNLSQALGKGYVQLIDWKSIENANMATVEFKETVLETAVAQKTLTKVGEGLYKTTRGNTVSISDFNSAMKDAWFTNDVLMASLDKYGAFANKLNQAYEALGHTVATSDILEYLEKFQKDGLESLNELAEDTGVEVETLIPIFNELSDASYDLGKRSFKAAQEAKTFAEAIAATKDAVSTGWMNTFEIIFGDYTEAKRIWTGLANELWEIFASGAEKRNDILKEWVSLGGRKLLFGDGEDQAGAIVEAWTGVKKIFEAVAKAYRQLFPATTADKLVALSQAVANFARKLQLSDEALYTIQVTAKTVLIPLKLLFEVVKVGATVFGYLVLSVMDAVNSFLTLLAVDNPLEKFLGAERYERIGAALTTIITRLGNAFGKLFDYISGGSTGSSLLDKILNIFANLLVILTPLAEWVLDKIVEGLEAIANADFQNIKNFAAWVKDGFEKIAAALGTSIEEIWLFQDAFQGKTLIQALDVLISRLTGIKSIANTLNTTFISGLSEAMGGLVDGIKNISDSMLGFVKQLSPAKILVFGFGASIVSLTAALAKVTTTFNGVLFGFSKVITALQKRLRPTMIERLSKLLIVLAGAIVIVAQIPAKQLLAATGAIAGLMVTFAALAGAMAAINKFLVGADIEKFEAFSKAMTFLAAGVLALSVAMLILSGVKLDGILPKLAVIAAIITGLGVAAVLVSKKAPEMSKGAIFLLAYAAAISTLMSAMQELAKADFTGVTQNIGALTVIIGALAGVAVLAKGLSFKSGVGLTLLISDLFLMIAAIKLIQKIPVKSLTQNLGSFITLLGLIAAMGLAAKIAGESTAKLGVGLITMAAAMLILTDSIKRIGELSTTDVVEGTAAVMGILAMFALITKSAVISDTQKIAKVGAGFIAMSVAVMALSIAMKYIGGMSVNEVVQGGIVVGAMLLLFRSIMKLGTEAKASAGAIAAMAVAIGTLTMALMLLTLPASEPGGYQALMVAVSSLGMVLLALGYLMKQLQSFKFMTSVGLVATIAVTIAGLTAALLLLKDIPADTILPIAESLSMIMLSLGMSTNIIKQFDWKAALGSAVLIGLLLAEIIGAMKLVDWLDIDVEKIVPAINEMIKVLAALTLVTSVLSLAKVGFASAFKGAAGLATATIIIGGLFTLIGFLESKYHISEFIKLAPTVFEAFHVMDDYVVQLAGLAVVMALMGLVAAPIMAGAVAFSVVVGALAIIMASLSKIDKLFGGVDLDRAAEFLGKIGEAIGLFIGALVGGLFSGMADAGTSGLPGMADNLTQFAEKIAVFFDTIDQIDESSTKKLDVIQSAMKNIQGIAQAWKNAQIDISTMGTDLQNFAPYAVAFASAFGTSDLTYKALTATEIVCDCINQLVTALPKKTIFDGIVGTTDLADFGKGLEAFGPGMKAFINDTKDLDLNEAQVESVVAVAKIVAGLAEALPRDNGVLQLFIGNQDLARFAQQMSNFAPYFSDFYTKIEGIGDISEGKVKTVKNMAMMMATLANNLPRSDGILQFFTGSKDIGAFGADLVNFASRFKEFWLKIVDMDLAEEDINKVDMMCTMLQHLVDMLPEDKGVLGMIFGGQKDIGDFGKALQDFTAGIESMTITARSYGEDMAIAFKSGIRFSKEKMEAAGKDLVTDICRGVKANTQEAEVSSTQIGNAMITAFKKSVDGKFEIAAKESVLGWNKGLDDNLSSAITKTKIFGDKVAKSLKTQLGINSPSKVFQEIGKFSVEGLVKGLDDNTPTAEKAMISVGKKILTAIKEDLGIHSPSKVFQDEVGHWIIMGVVEGLTKDTTPEEIASKKAEAIASAFSEALEGYQMGFNYRKKLEGIWDTVYGTDATDEEKAAHARENLELSIRDSFLKLNNLRGKYAAMLENSGGVITDDVKNVMIEIADAYDEVTTMVKEITDMDNEEYNKFDKNTIWDSVTYREKFDEAVDYVTDYMQMSKDNAEKGGYTFSDYLETMYHMDENEFRRYLYKRKGFDENMQQIINRPAKKKVAENLAHYLEMYGYDSSQMDETFKEIEQFMKDTVDTSWELKYEEDKKTATKSGKNSASGYVEGVNNGLGEAAKEFNPWGILTGGDFGAEAAKEYGEGFMGVLDKAGDWVLTGGKNIIYGLGDTLTSIWAKTQANDAGATVAEEINEGFKEEEDINSPSKVWGQFGTYLVEGLSEGMTNTVDPINSGVDSIVTALNDHFTENQSSFEANGNDIVESISNGMTDHINIFADAGDLIGNSFMDSLMDAVNSKKGELWTLLQSVLKLNVDTSKTTSGYVPVYTSGSSRGTPFATSLSYADAYRLNPQQSSKLADQIAADLSKAKVIKSQNDSDSEEKTKVINQTFNQTINAGKAASAAVLYRTTKNAIAQENRRLEDV